MHYSNEFKEIMKDKKKIQFLMKESHYPCQNFEQWKQARFIISQAINKNGKILDIGCANGFLLRCFQEWSPYGLEPYGIDISLKQIYQAREIFPLKPNNFVFENFWNLITNNFNVLKRHNLPTNYDFIYWNVWDSLKFENKTEVNALNKVFEMVSSNGRLILGFYDSDNNKAERIKRIQGLGYTFSGRLETAPYAREVVVWINKQ